MSETNPIFGYLATCSKPSLEAFELGRLNRAANLRKELRDILEEWIQAEGEARLARWLLEGRRAQDSEMHVSGKEPVPRRGSALQVPLSFPRGRDESAEWSLTSGAAPLDDGEESRDRARDAATCSIPVLPARPEMQEPEKLDGAKASVPEAARLAELGSADSYAASGVPNGAESIHGNADEGERKPPRLSGADALAERQNASVESCNLHPAIQLRLVPRRVGDDPFGEADHAPPVEPSVGVHLLKAPARQEIHAPAQFRIHFGRPVARGGEMAAAS